MLLQVAVATVPVLLASEAVGGGCALLGGGCAWSGVGCAWLLWHAAESLQEHLWHAGEAYAASAIYTCIHVLVSPSRSSIIIVQVSPSRSIVVVVLAS